MDEEYDVIILGTGLTECVLSGLLSQSIVEGKRQKVLHMDRNGYYGGESTSLSPLDKVFKHFYGGEVPAGLDLDKYGKGRDWNVDLIPKFLMANGKLVQLLIHTDVTKYLEFKSVDGSFVLKANKKIDKVPSNEKEALTSGLFGMFEKKRLRDFITFVHKFDEKDPTTWKTKNFKDFDPKKHTVAELYQNFNIDENTQSVCGHSLALYRDEKYKEGLLPEFAERCRLYSDSLSRYGKSPYLYPLYGLGELPQGFARLSAIYGGTYMLDKEDAEIVYNEEGLVIGVKSKGEMARCKKVICDPSYAMDKVQQPEHGKQVVRAICFLDHPIPSTNDVLSCQIIIPQMNVGRDSDIYVSMVSYTHNIAAKGYYVAIVSTTVETANPEAELQPGIDLLGSILQKFVKVYDIYEPTPESIKSNVFISRSYDATSHFETTCDDIVELYEKVMNEPIDFKALGKQKLDMEQQQQ